MPETHRVVCSTWCLCSSDADLVRATRCSAHFWGKNHQVYYNYTGQAGRCFNFGGSEAAVADADDGADDGPPSGWGYQTCTEVFQPTPSNGLYPAPGGDMFPPSTPNKTAIYQSCQQRYGVVPRADWEETHFWGCVEISFSLFFSLFSPRSS